MTSSRCYWPLLFPLTYLIHILEEYYGGFPAWASHHLFNLTTREFLELNTVAWIFMLGLSVLAMRFASMAWLTVSLATATLINSCAHAFMSGITASYSPGLISSLSLWVPLAIMTLRRYRQQISARIFWPAVGVGFVLHLTVTLLAYTGTTVKVP